MELSGRFDDLASPAAARLLAGFLAESELCLLAKTDDHGLVLSANPALERQMGGKGENRTILDILTAESAELWRKTLPALPAPSCFRSVNLGFRADSGTATNYRCLLVRAADASIWLFGEPTVSGEPIDSPRLSTQLSGLIKAWAEADQLARTDSLTGLANRRQADAWLSEIGHEDLPADRAGGCMMVDIDHLKAVNDAHGHAAGDRLLRAVALVLAEEVQTSGRVARFGGDEFLVLLPSSDRAVALALAERMRERVGGLIVPPLDQALTISIGLACYRDGEPAEGLRDRADAALLVAKRASRNRVEFLP
jgi:diguanylate cyclase (GGDEF)-like protein